MSTALITGANRGLGLEFVKQYAADGWDIIACCRDPQKGDKLAALATANKKIRIEALTVTDEKSIAALAVKLKTRPIDLLINNAGIYSGTGAEGDIFTDKDQDTSQTFGTMNAEAWDRVLRTNTIAPIMVAQALAANVAQSKKGKIVMITSRMGSISDASEGAIAYRSSKAALNAAMHNIAMTLKAQNIITISIHPGWVKTDMGGPGASLTPEQSITGMRKVIDKLTQKSAGEFFGYDGTTIPW